MPGTPVVDTRNARRMVVMRLVIDMLRDCYAAYFDDGNFGGSAELILICMVISMGQIEGKPVSASTIADYLGIPRATAMRKLTELQSLDLVRRVSRTSYIFKPLDVPPGQLQIRTLATLERRIHEASTALLKLNS